MDCGFKGLGFTQRVVRSIDAGALTSFAAGGLGLESAHNQGSGLRVLGWGRSPGSSRRLHGFELRRVGLYGWA